MMQQIDMSKPAGVLAVMARELQFNAIFRPEEVREAYSAVAGLIEAAEKVAQTDEFLGFTFAGRLTNLRAALASCNKCGRH